jgi:hypothetical protein
MRGHLFVVHGDLLGLACDALLIPSGTAPDAGGSVRAGHVTAAWRTELGDALEGEFLTRAPDREQPVVLVPRGRRHPTPGRLGRLHR